MNKIEKMYENVEIKKQIPKVCSSNELYCKECEAHIEDAMPYCKNAEYPPFTAEKQLALIKWISKKKFVIYDNLSGWFMGIIPTYSEELGIVCKDRATNTNSFEEALARLINKLWQDLTKEEKQQIKEILSD